MHKREPNFYIMRYIRNERHRMRMSVDFSLFSNQFLFLFLFLFLFCHSLISTKDFRPQILILKRGSSRGGPFGERAGARCMQTHSKAWLPKSSAQAWPAIKTHTSAPPRRTSGIPVGHGSKISHNLFLNFPNLFLNFPPLVPVLSMNPFADC